MTTAPASTPAAATPVEEVAPVVVSARERLQSVVHDLEEEKKALSARITELKNIVKLYDSELKKTHPKKRSTKPRDPSKPVLLNGIAKPQKISTQLATFLHKHFGVEKGRLVSRTEAMSKTNGLSKYITDQNLRSNGEIKSDPELVKLFGKPTTVSKDGKTKVFKHPILMKLIGDHFPATKAASVSA